jgi:DNA-binding beta-propeller fold protein YncE
VIVRVTGKTFSRVADAPIGRWSQGTVFSPDGKTILVGNMIEKDYWVFQWDGSSLKDTGQRVKVNGGPAAIRTAEK